jgi:hypothetical protein
VSSNTPNYIVVNHDGLKFGFSRDKSGDGYFFCLSSKSGHYGSGIGYVVPVRYFSEILQSAISQGIDPSLLSRTLPETAKKSPAVSGVKSRSVKSDDSLGIKIF